MYQVAAACLKLVTDATDDQLTAPPADTECGRDIEYIFTEELSAKTIRRGTTWKETGDRTSNSEGARSAKQRHLEVAELLFVTSRLYVAALARKCLRLMSPERGQGEGTALVLAGQSDEASFRLRVCRQEPP